MSKPDKSALVSGIIGGFLGGVIGIAGFLLLIFVMMKVG